MNKFNKLVLALGMSKKLFVIWPTADSDQTAPKEQSDQACTVCSDASVPIFRGTLAPRL